MVAGSDPGHALPGIGVAAALGRRGHRVGFVSGTVHAGTARQHGVDLTGLPSLPADDGDGDIGHVLWGRAAAAARRLCAALSSAPPEVMVVDSLIPAGGLAAQLLGVPWVELIPHHLPDPAPDLPPVGLGRRLARTPIRRADDRRIHRAQRRSVALGVEQGERAARALGLRHLEAPSLRLVATLPALERTRKDWPPTAHVVGPLAVDPLLPELHPPGGDEPLVVVTDSTAATIDRSIGEVAARALVDLPLRVVITSGSMEPYDDDRMVIGRGPHAPLLALAALAIGPGGGGFLSKTLAAGVPIVVAPLAGDQREAARRLQDTRAGRTLSPARLTPRRLRWAVVRHLADPSAYRAACMLRNQAAELGGDLAARLVEAVADGQRPVASGPSHHLRRSEGSDEHERRRGNA